MLAFAELKFHHLREKVPEGGMFFDNRFNSPRSRAMR
jgi:hypothetical protein